MPLDQSYMCLRVCVHVSMHACARTSVHVRARAYVHALVRACMCMRACECAFVHVYRIMHVCIQVYVPSPMPKLAHRQNQEVTCVCCSYRHILSLQP